MIIFQSRVINFANEIRILILALSFAHGKNKLKRLKVYHSPMKTKIW